MEIRKCTKQHGTSQEIITSDESENKGLTSLRALLPISQSLAKRLKSTLSYRHLKSDYFIVKSNISHSTPFYNTRVSAGPPSNVEDYIEQHLDLNEYLTGNSNTIFCIQVEGDSMIGAGVNDNDILVVDRSIEPVDGKIVIASVNSELTVKRLRFIRGQVILMPENPSYSPIIITEEVDLKIWGVVIHVIHSLVS